MGRLCLFGAALCWLALFLRHQGVFGGALSAAETVVWIAAGLGLFFPGCEGMRSKYNE